MRIWKTVLPCPVPVAPRPGPARYAARRSSSGSNRPGSAGKVRSRGPPRGSFNRAPIEQREAREARPGLKPARPPAPWTRRSSGPSSSFALPQRRDRAKRTKLWRVDFVTVRNRWLPSGSTTLSPLGRTGLGRTGRRQTPEEPPERQAPAPECAFPIWNSEGTVGEEGTANDRAVAVKPTQAKIEMSFIEALSNSPDPPRRRSPRADLTPMR